MHNVIDGNPSLVPIMHQLTHYRDCDKFLKWLVSNNITGLNLISWLKEKFDNSILLMVTFIVQRNNKDYKIKHGRDWK